LQDRATAENLSRELTALIEDRDYRRRVIEGLARVRENLGAGDGARNMAQLVVSLIDGREH
jgi:hypothetical protein